MPNRVVADITTLCDRHRGRLTGTDAERRAANHLAASIRASGWPVRVEPIHTHPQAGTVHMLHCLLALVGSLITPVSPPAAFALVLAAATGLYLDLNGRPYPLRRLLFRRASQNVVSPPAAADERPAIVLCANYDAGRLGVIHSETATGVWGRVAALSPVPLTPMRLVFWSIASLLPLIGARAAGVEAAALEIAQLPGTLVLLAAALLLGEAELSETTPGANDNASAAAGVVELARRLSEQPLEHCACWLVLSGGGAATHEGMHRFLAAHAGELDRARTRFIALDAIGAGEVRFEASAGWVISHPSDPRMFELCEAIAAAEPDLGARPWRNGTGTESLPPRLRGYGAISIAARDPLERKPLAGTPLDTPDRIDPATLSRALSLAELLVRRLDDEAAGGRWG